MRSIDRGAACIDQFAHFGGAAGGQDVSCAVDVYVPGFFLVPDFAYDKCHVIDRVRIIQADREVFAADVFPAEAELGECIEPWSRGIDINTENRAHIRVRFELWEQCGGKITVDAGNGHGFGHVFAFCGLTI